TSALTVEIFTLSLHDALPISDGPPYQSPIRLRYLCLAVGSGSVSRRGGVGRRWSARCKRSTASRTLRRHYRPPHMNENLAANSPDRKSTRLNSSHEWISYAVF